MNLYVEWIERLKRGEEVRGDCDEHGYAPLTLAPCDECGGARCGWCEWTGYRTECLLCVADRVTDGGRRDPEEAW